jgi:hypothetical protein
MASKKRRGLNLFRLSTGNNHDKNPHRILRYQYWKRSGGNWHDQHVIDLI